MELHGVKLCNMHLHLHMLTVEHFHSFRLMQLRCNAKYNGNSTQKFKTFVILDFNSHNNIPSNCENFLKLRVFLNRRALSSAFIPFTLCFACVLFPFALKRLHCESKTFASKCVRAELEKRA